MTKSHKIYHSRKNLRSSRNDLRSFLPKRFPTKITLFVWKKFCANFVNKLSLPSPFVCTKVLPKLLKNQFQKYFWAFMILNHFKLILSFFLDGMTFICIYAGIFFVQFPGNANKGLAGNLS